MECIRIRKRKYYKKRKRVSMIFVKKLNIGIFFFFYRPPLPAWFIYILIRTSHDAFRAESVIQINSVAVPPTSGRGFLKIHIPLCCWKRTLIFTFLCTYIMTFFKLFHCNVGRFAYSHIKSLKNIYKGKMHVARPCRYFEMIFSMCKQTKNQHIQKQI